MADETKFRVPGGTGRIHPLQKQLMAEHKKKEIAKKMRRSTNKAALSILKRKTE